MTQTWEQTITWWKNRSRVPILPKLINATFAQKRPPKDRFPPSEGPRPPVSPTVPQIAGAFTALYDSFLSGGVEGSGGGSGWIRRDLLAAGAGRRKVSRSWGVHPESSAWLLGKDEVRCFHTPILGPGMCYSSSPRSSGARGCAAEPRASPAPEPRRGGGGTFQLRCGIIAPVPSSIPAYLFCCTLVSHFPGEVSAWHVRLWMWFWCPSGAVIPRVCTQDLISDSPKGRSMDLPQSSPCGEAQTRTPCLEKWPFRVFTNCRPHPSSSLGEFL